MLSSKTSTRIVVVAIIIFCLYFGLVNWLRQDNLITSQFDMGNMDQVLWHSLHGQWFLMNSPTGATQHLRTAIHADYLLLAYLPFYAIFPDPRTMLVLQVLCVASGAIPLFWLARKKLGPTLGAAVAIAYLFYAPLEYAVIFDVHAVVLATPLLLWAWWAAAEKRWWVYYASIALAVVAKEQVGLVIAAMGVYWGWRPGYRTMGMSSIILGIGWTALMLGWAIPSARNAPGHFALGYYEQFGGSFGDIIKNIFARPDQTLADVFSGQSFSLYRALLFPVGLLALFGWPIIVALPELAVNLLSNNANQKTIFFQYMSVITPFIFLATIDGATRLQRWVPVWKKRWPRISVRDWAITGISSLAIAAVWFWSPLPLTHHHWDAVKVFYPSPYKNDVKYVQRLVKPTDRVVTTNNLGPQFSRREQIWGFPNDLDKADAIVILQGARYDLLPPAEINDAVLALTTDPRFTLVYHRELFWYFRRSE